ETGPPPDAGICLRMAGRAGGRRVLRCLPAGSSRQMEAGSGERPERKHVLRQERRRLLFCHSQGNESFEFRRFCFPAACRFRASPFDQRLKEQGQMRFMLIVRANEDSEAGVMPSNELLEAMGKFNEEMVNAGVLLAGEGLHASAKGARVHFSGGKPTVIDG